MELWKDNRNIEFQEYIDSPNLSSASDLESENIVGPLNTKQESKSKDCFLPINGKIPTDIGTKQNIRVVATTSYEADKAQSKAESFQLVNEDQATFKKTGLPFNDAPPPQDASFTSEASFITLSQVPSESPASASFISEEDILFKKREIKCKNIRRHDFSIKRSVSPEENRVKRQEVKYPKDWLEYREMKLNAKQDALLKSKVLKSSENKKFDFKRYFNFHKPPLQAEPYRYERCNGSSEWSPFRYLRHTVAKPQIIYSTNHRKTSPTPLNKRQLFAIIPDDRKSIIEKLWKYSRLDSVYAATTVRTWYPRKWKSVDNSEAKLLENSVGLSFLQGYSDEEENHSEEHALAVIDVADETEPHIENTLENLEGIITMKGNSRWEPLEQTNSIIEDTQSRWDSEPSENQPVEDIKTPPLVKPELIDKEEGEVTEEEYTPQTPELPKKIAEEILPSVDVDVEEYERTKHELLKLEEALKSSTSYLEELNAKESEKHAHVSKNKDTKKKRKKIASLKVSKIKESKKKSKRKKNKKSETDSTEEISIKKKRKPDMRKVKNKLKKKRKGLKSESELKEKQRKKIKETENRRRRTISGESDLKDHKPEAEDYADDIKFFAERLDAERELKGKSKLKTKGIPISVDDLAPKADDKILKRNSSESDECRSKISQGVPKKEEVKVDLLKMNEEYMREQKRKEEVKIRESRSLSLEKCREKPKPEKINGGHKYEDVKAVAEIYKEKETSNNQVYTEKIDTAIEELTDILIQKEISIKQENSDERRMDIAPNLEMPLQIQHVPRTEIKIEKDLFDIEEPPSKVNFVENILTRKEQPDLRLHLLEIKLRKNEANALTPTKKKKPWDVNSSKGIVTLEDEYQEFMKAVTLKNEDIIDKLLLDDSASESSVTFLEELSSSKPARNIRPVEIPLPMVNSNPSVDMKKTSIVNSEEIILLTSKDSTAPTQEVKLACAPPLNIETPCEYKCVPDSSFRINPLKSLPEVKLTSGSSSLSSNFLKPVEFKPVPVPSPKLELNQPLINLSLSANVTQNITFSLGTSMPSISAPITSTIDVSKPKVEICSSLPAETYYVPNAYFTPEIFQLPPPPPPPPEESSTKLTFTSLALPPKKLIDNSRLNLGDSDGDNEKILEEERRKRLEILKEDNKREADKDQARMSAIISKLQDISKGEDTCKKSSPRRSSRQSRNRDPLPRRDKKGRRESPSRHRSLLPRRRSPVNERKRSPRRLSPRRRSSPRRKKYSGGRSDSQKRRRSIVSPRKRYRSPSPKKMRSRSPKKIKPQFDKVKRDEAKKLKDLSPLQRSLPDSTISDDQLTQENYIRFNDPEYFSSPKRVSLDIRISEVLGYENRREPSPKPICTITTPFYDDSESFHVGTPLVEGHSKRNIPPTLRTVENQVMYKQVGNIMQIVPMEQENSIANCSEKHGLPVLNEQYQQQFQLLKPVIPEHWPQVVQVGNVLEVVPTEISDSSFLQIKTELLDESFDEQKPDKASPKATMLQKEADRREEREARRMEREKRRAEKERRRQEREKIRFAKTQDMIRKALEEEEEETERAILLKSEMAQWPPLPTTHHTISKDAGKSILTNSGSRLNDLISIEEKIQKVVQFADGVRPGYGTSPSAGEDLSSSPPPKRTLPKEKRYKKLKFHKKTAKKKKVKVKVMRKTLEESDSDDSLPPPSPPPGSPPPHVYPPRIKLNVTNNAPTSYLASIMQTVQQLQTPPPSQVNLYRTPPPPVNLLMPPPPLSHMSPQFPPTSHVQSPNVMPTHLPPPHVPTPHIPPPHLQSPLGTPSHTTQSPQGSAKTSRWSST